jgi:hypothetical protein
MGEPAERTIRRLFALSGNRCAFPRCALPLVESAGTITGEICHIKAKSTGGPRYEDSQTDEERHAFENLILLCRRHHRFVDAEPEVYSAEALQEIKSIHEGVVGRPEQATDGFFAKLLLNDLRRVSVVNNSGNVAINSPGAIQAQTVNVRASRRSVTISAPPGTIGADQQASPYVQHLIKRYNEFASADKTRRTRFSFGALSSNIESRFGAPWKLLPAEQFGSVCEYLQQRIAKTILAKQNQAKGIRSFSSYAEFQLKHGYADE